MSFEYKTEAFEVVIVRAAIVLVMDINKPKEAYCT
jgi:hypothetical protein